MLSKYVESGQVLLQVTRVFTKLVKAIRETIYLYGLNSLGTYDVFNRIERKTIFFLRKLNGSNAYLEILKTFMTHNALQAE